MPYIYNRKKRNKRSRTGQTTTSQTQTTNNVGLHTTHSVTTPAGTPEDVRTTISFRSPQCHNGVFCTGSSLLPSSPKASTSHQKLPYSCLYTVCLGLPKGAGVLPSLGPVLPLKSGGWRDSGGSRIGSNVLAEVSSSRPGPVMLEQRPGGSLSLIHI